MPNDQNQSPPKPPEPTLSVVTLGVDGHRTAGPADVTKESAGWKGFGLASVPPLWSSPFFVIDGELAAQADKITLESLIACAQLAGINVDKQVIVRSSGTEETLSERGNLESAHCSITKIPETLRSLLELTAAQHRGRVHWLVQEHHNARAKGHFSNERRISSDKRDWVLEMEPRHGHPPNSSPVAVRQWRDGADFTSGELTCNSEARISVCLKQVAIWAQQFNHRLHFEWVWDGQKVLIVQLDREDSSLGVRPQSLLPPNISKINPGALSAFRVATPEDFASFRKLKNANLYRQLGYDMPPFYVLTDLALIGEIVNHGTLTDSMRTDLALLTSRSLILRTDGIGIPEGKSEMLPRSDELRSVNDATHWLTDTFRAKITEAGLAKTSLVLIAHHFIPSLASAWARAEPGRPFVRIEALWGIPEGLYWFSHDTFEVDTLSAELPPGQSYQGVILSARKRLRFKGTFVAANDLGRWVPHSTLPPHDWRPTIGRKRWLSEIAWTTKQVAQMERQPVSLMWFIGNHTDATPHKILPWFHSESALDTPKAAPRTKFRSSADFTIYSANDWQELQTRSANQGRIERVIVEPRDPELIRNRAFAEALAELAKEQEFVVQLAGGVLSHAYYVLSRSGARVECIDLFGGEEDVADFYKVVRDRVPEVISKRGEQAYTVRLKGDALIVALKRKLVEEAFEALDALSGEELVSELADVAEVLKGLASALELDPNRIESERVEKRRKRGGFDQGYMLTRTTTPDSLLSAMPASAPPENAATISEPARVPGRPSYRRPDLRQSGELEIEKLLAVETEINRLDGEVKEILNFEFPAVASQGPVSLSLVLELRRQAGVLRSTVRVRRTPTQMTLALDDRQLSLFSAFGSEDIG